MKIAELRQLSDKKLREELVSARRDGATVRFHAKTGQNQNTAKIVVLRKKVAQIKTLLNERALELKNAA